MASLSMGFPLEAVPDLGPRQTVRRDRTFSTRGGATPSKAGAAHGASDTSTAIAASRQLLEAERAEVARLKARLESELEALAAEKDAMRAVSASGQDLVELNVGGCLHTVKRATLCQVKDSLLASMFSGRWEASLDRDKDGRVFLDLEPQLFTLILNHLRHTRLLPSARFDLSVVDMTRKPAFRDLVEFLGLQDAFYRLHCEHAEHGQNATVACERCRINSFRPLQTVFVEKPLCAVCAGSKSFQSRGLKCSGCRQPIATLAHVDMAFTNVLCDKCHAAECD